MSFLKLWAIPNNYITLCVWLVDIDFINNQEGKIKCPRILSTLVLIAEIGQKKSKEILTSNLGWLFAF